MICPKISDRFYKLKAWHGQHAPNVFPGGAATGVLAALGFRVYIDV
jgi:hypothetical protein